MMNNCVGYDCMVRDAETKELLYISKVIANDTNSNTIELDIVKEKIENNKQLELTIYNEKQAYSYKGKAHWFSGSNYIEVGLYRGMELTGRIHQRYMLKINATIVGFIGITQKQFQTCSVPVKILDISRSGIGIESSNHVFQRGDQFIVQLVVGKISRFYYAMIVRNSLKDKVKNHYGCMLMTKEEYIRNNTHR